MNGRLLRVSLCLALIAAITSLAPVGAQQVQRLPLAPRPPTGEPVAPFFEGWYGNADGTYTFSFGYFNLNMEEILEIPIGPDNFVEPAAFNGGQPTHFPVDPRRDRGVFTVTVPASYGDGQGRVVWTIRANGVTYSVPARAGIEALQLDYGPRGMGSVPPLLRLEPNGMEGQHPTGVRLSQPRVATVGNPLALTVWASEVSERFDHEPREQGWRCGEADMVQTSRASRRGRVRGSGDRFGGGHGRSDYNGNVQRSRRLRASRPGGQLGCQRQQFR